MKRLSVLIVSLVAAAASHAGTVSYNFTNALGTTEINQSGNLGLFDSTLGTLTGATLTLDGAALLSFSGTNNAAQAQSANITVSTNLSFTSSLAALNGFINDDLVLSASSGSQNYAIGQTRAFGPFDVVGSNNDDLFSILGSLQNAGGGNFSISCTSLSGLSVFGGGGNLGTTQATEAGCGASIVYTYREAPPTNVPEPGSLALAGLALAGLAFASRRKS